MEQNYKEQVATTSYTREKSSKEVVGQPHLAVLYIFAAY